MPASYTGLAVNSSGDGLLADALYGMAVDGQILIEVEPTSYKTSPVDFISLSPTDILVSGSDILVSLPPDFNVTVSKIKNIEPGIFSVFGSYNQLLIDNQNNLNLGNDYILGVSKYDSYSVAVKKSITILPNSYLSIPNKASTHKQLTVFPEIISTSSNKISLNRSLSVFPGTYDTAKDPTGLTVDLDLNSLSIGPDNLSVNQFSSAGAYITKGISVAEGTYSLELPYYSGPVVSRAIPVNIGEYSSIFPNVAVKIKQKVIIDPIMMTISPTDVYIKKNNNFNLETGSYSINSISVTTSKISSLIEGKYIKDSSNYYELYVDSGIDYFILIDTRDLGIVDNTDFTFIGSFAKDKSSISKYDIECSKVTSEMIKLTIRGLTTYDLYGRYLFDIISSRNTTTNRLMTGSVIIKQTIEL